MILLKRSGGNNLFVLIIATLFFVSCVNTSQDKIEGVDFSCTSYIQKGSNNDPLPFDSTLFQRIDNSDLGFFRGTIWTRIHLKSDLNEPKSIVITNNDKLNRTYNLFKRDSNTGAFSRVSVSTNAAYTDGRTFKSANPNFKIELNANQSETFYIQSTSDGRTYQGQFHLYEIDDYLQTKNIDAYVNGFFYGSLFIIFLINLFFWRSFNNKIHGLYSFYILFTIITYAGLDGYLYDQNIKLHIVDHLIFISLRALVIFLVLFSASFLKIDILAPKFFSYIKKSVLILPLITTSYQLIYFESSIGYLHQIENFITILWIIVLLVMLGICLKQQRKEINYYLIALIVFLFFLINGELVHYYKSINILGINFNTFYKIGTTSEVLIFTYTIIAVLKVKETNQYIRNKEIQIAKESAESENLMLKSKIEDSNEQKVELMAALKLVETNLNNEQEWEAFKHKINELNPNFIGKLKNENPKLSKNDIRLLVLIKIGFTQKEIAQLLFIAENSVKKSKQRIRKKLNLSTDITLPEFLSQV